MNIAAGAVLVGNSNALGSGTIPVAAGGQLRPVNDNYTVNLANAVVFNGQTAGGAFYAGDYDEIYFNFNGPVVLNADANFNIIWNDKHVAVNGQITGPGRMIVEPTQSNTPLALLTINGGSAAANSFAGVTVGNGVAPTEVDMRGDVNALGGPGSTTVVNPQGVVDINISQWDTWYIPGNFTLNGGTLRNGDGYNHLTGSISLAATSTVQVRWSNHNMYLDGVVSGAGGTDQDRRRSTGPDEYEHVQRRHGHHRRLGASRHGRPIGNAAEHSRGQRHP